MLDTLGTTMQTDPRSMVLIISNAKGTAVDLVYSTIHNGEKPKCDVFEAGSSQGCQGWLVHAGTAALVYLIDSPKGFYSA